MPNHIDEPSNNQSTVTAPVMHTVLVQTKTSKPLGDLSVLPRELRDEIYRHVYSNTYMCYSRAFTQYVRYFRGEHYGSRSPLLRTSKAILHEAIPFLYSAGTFCFNFNTDLAFLPLAPQHPKVNVADLVTNINVFCDVGVSRMGRPMYGYSSAQAGPLTPFQGVSITRKSILIDLRLWQCSTYATKILVSPLFEVFKNMTGFKTVKLRLTSLANSFFPPQGTSDTIISGWTRAKQWEKLYAGLEPLLDAMTEALEPTLGSCCTISELVSPCDNFKWSGQRHVIFHPQDHLAAIAKAKKERMGT